MLTPFSDLISFQAAELLDDLEFVFIDVTVLKPIGGIEVGRYDSVCFNFNKGEATAYNYEGSALAIGRFVIAPAT